MNLITINTTTCNKCGICVKSCPISLISMSEENGFPFVKAENESRCISCGHCEAVCSESALKHSSFENDSLFSNNQSLEFEAKDLGMYFRNRRSIRNYLPKSIDKAVLEQIMDIVRYAPTGTNRQFNRWIIVSDKKVIEELTKGTINWMQALSRLNPEMAQRLNAPALIASFEKGQDLICRYAPHIVLCYTNANYTVGAKDATIASAHLELLLPSFGLGGCWAGYLMVALQNSPELKKVIGLDDSSAVHSALMVGYPKYKYYKIPNRNKTNVSWI